MDRIIHSLNEARNLLEKMIADKTFIQSISRAASLMTNSLKINAKIISCGNGGSMADAMHFAEEMTGKFRDERPSIPAIAISDPSHITCAANDYGFGAIFSRFIESMGNENDILFAISTSGNSENIIRAAETARSRSMKIIALTGKDGGKLSSLSDVEIRIPHFGYSDRIQEMHIKVIHIIIELVEAELKAD
jgi:D-sedoheptulose 7-phosphate isomerase